MHPTRREFIRGAAGSALFFLGADPLSSLLARGPGLDNDGILVLLQLSGGNDGLSTVIPYGDPAYARNRRRTRVQEQEMIQLDAHVALHPNLKGFGKLFKEGHLAVVQGIGYPNPNRSHFKSLDIWHAASPRGRSEGTGWIGRFVDTAFAGSDDPNLVIHVGNRIPFSLTAAVHRPVAFTTPEAYRWTGTTREEMALAAAAPICEHEASPATRVERPSKGRDRALERMRKVLREAQASSQTVREAAARYRPKVEFPRSPIATNLATVAALISGGLGTRVYSVEMGGFDTHVNQKGRHDNLMNQLDGALTAFYRDLEKRGLADRVCIFAFSEFGRRVRENGSGGTDHGVAGQAFLIGGRVKGGLHGRYPSLTELQKGDLVHTVDFRSVYATIIDRHFGADHKVVLGRRWKMLPLI